MTDSDKDKPKPTPAQESDAQAQQSAQEAFDLGRVKKSEDKT